MSVSKTEGLGSNPSAPAKIIMTEQKLEEIFYTKAKELKARGALFNATQKNLESMKKHDFGTFLHQIRVALVAERIATLMGIKDVRPEFFGGANHDVGKLSIETRYLKEKKLTPEGFEEIKKHVDGGKSVLDDFFFISCIAAAHHTLQGHSYGQTIEESLGTTKLTKKARERLECALVNVSIADFFDACNSRETGLLWGQEKKDCSNIHLVYAKYSDRINLIEQDSLIFELYSGGQVKVDNKK
jgi:hypothetical protein